MNLVDPRTVVVLAGAMSGLMSIVFFFLRRRYPKSIRGIGEWYVSMFLFFVGGILFACRGLLPDILTLPFSIALVLGGLYLAYIGMQNFFGVRPRILPHLALLLLIIGAEIWFTLADPNALMRLRIFTVASTYLYAANSLLILRQPARSFPKIFTASLFGFAAIVQSLRLIATFLQPQYDDLFDLSPQNLIHVLTFAFSVILLSIGVMQMISERLLDDLERLASHDPLTNALTRRQMSILCKRELVRSARYGHPFALMIMDLDHFKMINDNYGHQVGDQVLVSFVKTVSALLRQGDHLCRFGGEEFVALLPETSPDEALTVAERIRHACELPPTHPFCTVSIGIASAHGGADSEDAMIQRADAALYAAKSGGRNQVGVA